MVRKTTKKIKGKKAKKIEVTKKEKKPKKKIKKEKEKIEKIKETEKYFEGVGRRKTSVARVRIFTKGDKTFLVNKKPLNVYFSDSELQNIATESLQKMKLADKFKVSARVKGGGAHSQAEAIRHGLARVLVIFNPDFRKRLKKAGFLKRDPRMKERKKFGLKRARKAPQWQKR